MSRQVLIFRIFMSNPTFPESLKITFIINQECTLLPRLYLHYFRQQQPINILLNQLEWIPSSGIVKSQLTVNVKSNREHLPLAQYHGMPLPSTDWVYLLIPTPLWQRREHLLNHCRSEEGLDLSVHAQLTHSAFSPCEEFAFEGYCHWVEVASTDLGYFDVFEEMWDEFRAAGVFDAFAKS